MVDVHVLGRCIGTASGSSFFHEGLEQYYDFRPVGAEPEACEVLVVDRDRGVYRCHNQDRDEPDAVFRLY